MVVSFNFYAVLYVIELISAVVFLVFCFIQSPKKRSAIIRLITSSLIVITDLAIIPMLIQTGKSYWFNIACVIMFFINALFATYDLGKNN